MYSYLLFTLSRIQRVFLLSYLRIHDIQKKVNKKPFSGVKIPETSYERLHRFKILYSLSSLVVVLKLHETWNKKGRDFTPDFNPHE